MTNITYELQVSPGEWRASEIGWMSDSAEILAYLGDLDGDPDIRNIKLIEEEA